MADTWSSYKNKLIWTICVVAATGIVSRILPIGSLIWDKYLGDVVYAAVFYLILSLIWGKGSIEVKALLTIICVVSIEVFQLTQIPAQLNQNENFVVKVFAYVVLGSAFSWWDMLAYGIGIGGISMLDRWYLKETTA